MAACDTTNVPMTLTSRTLRNPAMSVSTKVLFAPMPAELTSPLHRPEGGGLFHRILDGALVADIDRQRDGAGPGPKLVERALDSAASSRSNKRQVQSAARSCRAQASPMPDPAPVTTTTGALMMLSSVVARHACAATTLASFRLARKPSWLTAVDAFCAGAPRCRPITANHSGADGR